MLKWTWLSLVIIVLDQVTKYLANTRLDWHQPLAVLPSLNLSLAYNTGAAFSFLSDASGWQRWLFIVLAIGVSIYIVFWLVQLQIHQRRLAVALALILGGAIGNVIDRVIHGYVIDFIDVYYRDWHWPTFNVADSAITIGAILLVVDAFRNRHE